MRPFSPFFSFTFFPFSSDVANLSHFFIARFISHPQVSFRFSFSVFLHRLSSRTRGACVFIFFFFRVFLTRWLLSHQLSIFVVSFSHSFLRSPSIPPLDYSTPYPHYRTISLSTSLPPPRPWSPPSLEPRTSIVSSRLSFHGAPRGDTVVRLRIRAQVSDKRYNFLRARALVFFSRSFLLSPSLFSVLYILVLVFPRSFRAFPYPLFFPCLQVFRVCVCFFFHVRCERLCAFYCSTLFSRIKP